LNKIMNIQREKSKAAAISVSFTILLVLLKLTVGLIVGSVSVISEAVNSGGDLVAATLTLFAVKTSGKSPDKEHPFGHGKAENISAFVEAMLILVAAIWIIYESVQKLINPQPLEVIGFGIAIMLFSAVASIVVSNFLLKVGRKTDSAALMADGLNYRTDVYTAAGVMVGLILFWAGGIFFPQLNLYWIDPIVAILVSFMIIRTSYRLASNSIRDLMDSSVPVEETNWVQDYISGTYKTIRSVHRLRMRKSGATRFIDLHLVVNSEMTVSDSHGLAERIETDIRRQFPNADVTVHIEPCDGKCSFACSSGCLLTEEEQKAVRTKAV
jgi:cation diffusion facilitator family transporter